MAPSANNDPNDSSSADGEPQQTLLMATVNPEATQMENQEDSRNDSVYDFNEMAQSANNDPNDSSSADGEPQQTLLMATVNPEATANGTDGAQVNFVTTPTTTAQTPTTTGGRKKSFSNKRIKQENQEDSRNDSVYDFNEMAPSANNDPNDSSSADGEPQQTLLMATVNPEATADGTDGAQVNFVTAPTTTAQTPTTTGGRKKSFSNKRIKQENQEDSRNDSVYDFNEMAPSANNDPNDSSSADGEPQQTLLMATVNPEATANGTDGAQVNFVTTPTTTAQTPTTTGGRKKSFSNKRIKQENQEDSRNDSVYDFNEMAPSANNDPNDPSSADGEPQQTLVMATVNPEATADGTDEAQVNFVTTPATTAQLPTTTGGRKRSLRNKRVKQKNEEDSRSNANVDSSIDATVQNNERMDDNDDPHSKTPIIIRKTRANRTKSGDSTEKKKEASTTSNVLMSSDANVDSSIDATVQDDEPMDDDDDPDFKIPVTTRTTRAKRTKSSESTGKKAKASSSSNALMSSPSMSSGGSNVHVCKLCNFKSSKRSLLTRHLKSHSEDRPHKCSICELGFKTLSLLQNHVNTHNGVLPHQCNFCDVSFKTSGALVRHIRYRHTHEKPHRCKECDYASALSFNLKRHMRCHTGEKPHQCNFCDAAFTTSSDLIRHIRYRHTHEKPHRCKECDYASVELNQLKRHMRCHTGEKPYVCDVCHQRFTRSNSLKVHRLIHTGNKPIFKCEFCPTTCGRKTDLRIHVQKLHSSDKMLTCKRCDQSFPDRYQYKLHWKTHEGEKCFKCDLCNYASVSARHLESHMLIHTNQKPFKCDLLGVNSRLAGNEVVLVNITGGATIGDATTTTFTSNTTMICDIIYTIEGQNLTDNIVLAAESGEQGEQEGNYSTFMVVDNASQQQLYLYVADPNDPSSADGEFQQTLVMATVNPEATTDGSDEDKVNFVTTATQEHRRKRSLRNKRQNDISYYEFNEMAPSANERSNANVDSSIDATDEDKVNFVTTATQEHRRKKSLNNKRIKQENQEDSRNDSVYDFNEMAQSANNDSNDPSSADGEPQQTLLMATVNPEATADGTDGAQVNFVTAPTTTAQTPTTTGGRKKSFSNKRIKQENQEDSRNDSVYDFNEMAPSANNDPNDSSSADGEPQQTLLMATVNPEATADGTDGAQVNFVTTPTTTAQTPTTTGGRKKSFSNKRIKQENQEDSRNDSVYDFNEMAPSANNDPNDPSSADGEPQQTLLMATVNPEATADGTDGAQVNFVTTPTTTAQTPTTTGGRKKSFSNKRIKQENQEDSRNDSVYDFNEMAPSANNDPNDSSSADGEPQQTLLMATVNPEANADDTDGAQVNFVTTPTTTAQTPTTTGGRKKSFSNKRIKQENQEDSRNDSVYDFNEMAPSANNDPNDSSSADGEPQQTLVMATVNHEATADGTDEAQVNFVTTPATTAQLPTTTGGRKRSLRNKRVKQKNEEDSRSNANVDSSIDATVQNNERMDDNDDPHSKTPIIIRKTRANRTKSGDSTEKKKEASTTSNVLMSSDANVDSSIDATVQDDEPMDDDDDPDFKIPVTTRTTRAKRTKSSESTGKKAKASSSSNALMSSPSMSSGGSNVHTLSLLQNHVNTHNGVRPHQCNFCDAAFTASCALVRHIRYRHTHEKPHRCKECDYASALSFNFVMRFGEKTSMQFFNSLKDHRLIHTGNKPIFKCEFCPTTCGRKTDLRIHVQKLHTSDKMLTCKREKCFKCDLCNYASDLAQHLKSHMLIHTNKKPFKCDVCDLSFRKKQLLKRHKNIYHNPNYVPPTPKEKTLECSQCKKAFRYKGNLIRHMLYEHPEPASINTDSTIAITIDPQTAAAPPRTSIPQTISRTRRVTRSASKTSVAKYF
ncbi:hypothetical protein RDWZM_006652 [Blomia tropicalis]|uniref:C2H2-type domain-containing protein n=1 Tax=Blomia tropicalis TaxID=40697 RepID=A0A9Q0RNS8_BLOTA|nr:hypothetical protein RDWZM_006652 [Blomia tropicalis]